MDLRQLEMFRAVAEQGSFTKAAERLHVSQSAVSRQVKLLEDEVGGALLRRGKSGASVTQAGEVLLRTTHRIEADLQDTLAQIVDTHALRRGRLTLAGGMTVCLFILPRVLRRYRRLYKGVDLRVVTGSSDVILRLIRSRSVDIGLLTLPIVARDLEVMPVLKEEMVVLSAPNHPLAQEKTVDAAQLGRYPLVLYEPGSNTRKLLDRYFLEQGVPVDVAMETENVEIIKAMVGSGLGVTVVPYAAVAKDIRAGRFAYARLRGQRLVRETAWVYLKSQTVPRAVSELLRVFDSMKADFGSKP